MFRLLQRAKRFIRAKLKLETARTVWEERPPRWTLKITALILVIALITAIYPIRMTFLPISLPKLGDIATEDVIAPIDFPVEKSPEVLQEETANVVKLAPLVLDFNEFTYDSIITRIDSFFSAALNLKAGNSNLDNQTRRLRLFFPEFNESTLRQFLTLDSIRNYKAPVKAAVSDVYYAGVFENSDAIQNIDNENVLIVKSNVRTPLKRDQIVSMDEIEAFAARSFNYQDQTIGKLLATLIAGLARPTLTVDYPQTEREKTLAIARLPREELSFKAGDVVLRRNHKVESVHLKWLDALAEHRVKTEESASIWQLILPILTRAMFVGFILSIFAAFLYFFKRREAFTGTGILAVIILILLQVTLDYLIGFKLDLSSYLVPFAIGSLLFAILFGLEVGLVATFSLAILTGVLNNFDFTSAFVHMATGSVACFSVRVVRRRSDFYRSILYISLTYISLIYLLEYLRFTEPEQMIVEFGYGILNAVLAPILVMGILPIFESIFNLTTDITLLELSDMNHPLLRRLAIEAPGTYHHSIVVGNLSEKAAEAIGANSLLARVGAYYHDIGKMEIAEYFVENQSGIRNKHEKLTPSMSALIIGSHVKKGVDLADQFDLPDKISYFIEEHHGTTLMSFFYSKAKESGSNGDLNEDDFRYPGPRPNSRETAIVMLADSIEAASRTLDDPKPSRIRNMVKRIINDKFQAGELSHSELTMHDLGLIEESFVNMLIGVFHARIDYPQKEEAE